MVEQGSDLVKAVGDSMAQIVTNIGKVSDLMEDVSRASDEQTSAIDQMSIAINQMDDVTQQNASLVEQTATASASLGDQARDLASAVAFFKVVDGKQPLSTPQSLSSPQEERALFAAELMHSQKKPVKRAEAAVDEWETF